MRGVDLVVAAENRGLPGIDLCIPLPTLGAREISAAKSQKSVEVGGQIFVTRVFEHAFNLVGQDALRR